jgi:hypothetical protein
MMRAQSIRQLIFGAAPRTQMCVCFYVLGSHHHDYSQNHPEDPSGLFPQSILMLPNHPGLSTTVC